MGKASRSKGVRGEAEVRRLYVDAGFAVRGLEGLGDQLAIGHGLTIFSECKRQEVWRLPLWLEQCWRECPAGALPVLAFRSSRWPWTAALPLERLLAALAGATAEADQLRAESELGPQPSTCPNPACSVRTLDAGYATCPGCGVPVAPASGLAP